jgi:hypothetical protein
MKKVRKEELDYIFESILLQELFGKKDLDKFEDNSNYDNRTLMNLFGDSSKKAAEASKLIKPYSILANPGIFYYYMKEHSTSWLVINEKDSSKIIVVDFNDIVVMNIWDKTLPKLYSFLMPILKDYDVDLKEAQTWNSDNFNKDWKWNFFYSNSNYSFYSLFNGGNETPLMAAVKEIKDQISQKFSKGMELNTFKKLDFFKKGISSETEHLRNRIATRIAVMDKDIMYKTKQDIDNELEDVLKDNMLE